MLRDFVLALFVGRLLSACSVEGDSTTRTISPGGTEDGAAATGSGGKAGTGGVVAAGGVAGDGREAGSPGEAGVTCRYDAAALACQAKPGFQSGLGFSNELVRPKSGTVSAVSASELEIASDVGPATFSWSGIDLTGAFRVGDSVTIIDDAPWRGVESAASIAIVGSYSANTGPGGFRSPSIATDLTFVHTYDCAYDVCDPRGVCLGRLGRLALTVEDGSTSISVANDETATIGPWEVKNVGSLARDTRGAGPGIYCDSSFQSMTTLFRTKP